MKLAPIALFLAIVAAVLLIAAGPGSRFGFWEFGTGFMMMRWAFFIGLGAAVLALVFLIFPATRRGWGVTLGAALVISAGTAWVPFDGYRTVQSLPFIHDITTDTGNPPAFVDAVPLRAEAPNPPEYAGLETARQQREAYPDIRPARVAVDPTGLFVAALETARNQGWEIVAAVPAEGRIEASATTFWFGFVDDVVIRIRPDNGGSRLDIRSKSRIGRSDVGANAARIRSYMDALQARLGPQAQFRLVPEGSY